MKNKYPIATRALLLIFISGGIFIASFHSHSDLEWNHSEAACPTGSHFTVNTILCPVCGFRLDGKPVDPASPMAIQNVIMVIHDEANSVADEIFTGPLNGRSPPFLS